MRGQLKCPICGQNYKLFEQCESAYHVAFPTLSCENCDFRIEGPSEDKTLCVSENYMHKFAEILSKLMNKHIQYDAQKEYFYE